MCMYIRQSDIWREHDIVSIKYGTGHNDYCIYQTNPENRHHENKNMFSS